VANCHDLFRKYLESIRLKQPKRSSLKTSRDANRERIRKHFREVLKRPVPRFHGQGSYMMHTGINPLEDEYDVDDGVYGVNPSPETHTYRKKPAAKSSSNSLGGR
jgi:hypothetical protein